MSARPEEEGTRNGLLPALERLWLCALFAATAAGAWDVFANGAELFWYEALEVLALYALLGAIATIGAMPVAALLLLVLKPWLGFARAAAVLLTIGLGGAILFALDAGAMTREAAFVAFLLTLLVAARASALRSFARVRRWRVHGGIIAVLLALLAVTPTIGRRLAKPSSSGEVARPEGQPDLVLIVLDTLRADHLGAYGDARKLSPNFDAFAAESTLWSSCFTPAPWTVPSHASLFTGLMPPSHGCSFEHHRWLDERFQTLAEGLAERHYQTGAFVANEWLWKANLLQGFETAFSVGGRFETLAIRRLLELIGWPERYADHGAADAVDRIDEWLAHRDRDRPLFLFVNLLEPHWRYLPPLSERLELTQPEPGVVDATRDATGFYGPLAMAARRPVREGVAASIRSLYAAAVKYQDEKLGELLAVLRSRLDLDRTVVAITADHGENLGEGGRWDHVFALNDALVHVPLAIRHPATFKPGERRDELVQLVDVPVTLFGLTDRDGRASLIDEPAGRSLVPAHGAPARDVVLLFGDPYLGHFERMAIQSGFNQDVTRFAGVLRGARGRNHKLVRSSLGIEQLFDLGADPAEVQDARGQLPDQADLLRARLEAELAALPRYQGPPLLPPEDRPLVEPDSSGLDGMGYFDDKSRKRR